MNPFERIWGWVEGQDNRRASTQMKNGPAILEEGTTNGHE